MLSVNPLEGNRIDVFYSMAKVSCMYCIIICYIVCRHIYVSFDACSTNCPLGTNNNLIEMEYVQIENEGGKSRMASKINILTHHSGKVKINLRQ